MIGFIAFRTLIFGDPVRGWPSMACIIFLVGGIQLFCMGILGEYLAKTYLETKHRPIYILKESSGESYKDRSREKMMKKLQTDKAYWILFAGALLLCWLFVLQYGIFGSRVDWVSQHSVLPDYFRQRFYATGNLFLT